MTWRLDRNVAGALAYMLGAVSGIAFLIAEKDDRYVRFHALQSTVVFLGVMVVALVFSSVPIIGWVLYLPFLLGVVVLWVFLMIQALRGHRYKLPYVGDFVEQQLGE